MRKALDTTLAFNLYRLRPSASPGSKEGCQQSQTRSSSRLRYAGPGYRSLVIPIYSITSLPLSVRANPFSWLEIHRLPMQA